MILLLEFIAGYVINMFFIKDELFHLPTTTTYLSEWQVLWPH